MKRLKKSNRVSWAPDAKLCQVRLFLSEDCPSKVGVKAQDQLQAKTSWISDSNCVDSDGRPSVFKGRHYVNPLKERLPHIPQIKWKCPPKFVLNYNWRVAAGEESEEGEAQKHREMSVLEAVYPRHSAIPPSPSVSLDVEKYDQDDSHIPLVPITPIEEEDDAADMPSDMAAPLNASINSQPLALPQGMLIAGNPSIPQCNPPASLMPSANEKPALEMLPGLQADVVVAAAAALTAILKSKEQGSLIDTDLLIKILSDPKMIEKLTIERKAPVNTETVPISGSKPVTPSAPLLSAKSDVVPKKLINEYGPPANTGTAPISGSTPVTMPVRLPSSKPDMVIKKLVNGHGASASTGTAPISGLKPSTPLVLFPCSKPDLVTIKKLINEFGAPDNTRNEPMSGSMPLTPVVSLSSPKPDTGVLPRPNLHPLPNVVQPGLPMKPPSPDAVPISSFSAITAPPVKDINYYKSLIKQHGERQETQDYNVFSQFGKPTNHLQRPRPKHVQNFKPIEFEPKNQKPCMYFNSSKGCRNGSNCPYHHAMPNKFRPGSVLEGPSAKKMKLGREITGRT